MKKIVYYVNQFYGQIGGEEAADQTPIVKEGSVGPAVVMQEALKDIGEVVATIVCGDNYFADHQDEALEEILKVVEENCFAVTYTVSTLSSPVNLNKERQGLTSTVRKT